MKNKKQKGFFILEAIIAIVVFIIGVVAVLEVQQRTVDSTSDAQYRVQAYNMANNLVNLMSMDYANIDGYVDGSAAEYVKWVDMLGKMLPRVAPEAGTEVTYDNASRVVTINIKWKTHGASAESTYTIQSYIF